MISNHECIPRLYNNGMNMYIKVTMINEHSGIDTHVSDTHVSQMNYFIFFRSIFWFTILCITCNC